MSNLSQQFPIVQYVADGIETVYTYPFLILQAATSLNDLTVYVTPVGQPPIPATQLQNLNVAYTVQDVGNPFGGTITFQPDYIPAGGSVITIARFMNLSIDTMFNQVQNFNGQNLDNAFERVVLIEQDIAVFLLRRSLSYAINATLAPTSTDTVIPVLGNNQIWQKVNGAIQAVTLVEGEDVSTLRSQLLSEVPSSDGASIIGYYDEYNHVPQLLSTFLNNLPAYILNIVSPTDPFPTGTILDFGGNVIPANFLPCDGSAVSRATYSALFAALTFVDTGQLTIGLKTISGLADTSKMYIGMPITGNQILPGTTVETIVDANNITMSQNAITTTASVITFYPWGYGDQSTTFNVPDFRRRSSIGSGGTVTANPLGVGNVTGQVGGEQLHSLLLAENGPHNHVYSTFTSVAFGIGDGPEHFMINGGVNLNTTTSGSGTGHNTYHPAAVVLKIIKI